MTTEKRERVSECTRCPPWKPIIPIKGLRCAHYGDEVVFLWRPGDSGEVFLVCGPGKHPEAECAMTAHTDLDAAHREFERREARLLGREEEP